MELVITLFLCGDLMLARGIDQALPKSVDPTLHEPYVKDARDYFKLAERKTGPIDTPISPKYIWGDALDELEKVKPDARIVNLENAVTTSDDWDRDKGIHYRMHPANVDCLTVADIDAAVLANNHSLDWGRAGLRETLTTLERAGVAPVGAGVDAEAAEAPVVIELKKDRRLLIFAAARPTAGVPRDWAAGRQTPGVAYLSSLGDQSFQRVKGWIDDHAREDDVVIFSVHWGGNWGYDIPDAQRDFARRLIDEAGVDIVHGHSSHHVKGLEIHNDRLILYGAGDFFNDYEGIGGHEKFRPDLVLMYFPELDADTGKLTGLILTPMQIKHFSLNRVKADDAKWLATTLRRESHPDDLNISVTDENRLRVRWE